jgi:hypothetical protein
MCVPRACGICTIPYVLDVSSGFVLQKRAGAIAVQTSSVNGVMQRRGNAAGKFALDFNAVVLITQITTRRPAQCRFKNSRNAVCLRPWGEAGARGMRHARLERG